MVPLLNIERLDLEALRQNAIKVSPQPMAYIIDMAKAEALDSLGQEEEGIKLAEKYL